MLDGTNSSSEYDVLSDDAKRQGDDRPDGSSMPLFIGGRCAVVALLVVVFGILGIVYQYKDTWLWDKIVDDKGVESLKLITEIKDLKIQLTDQKQRFQQWYYQNHPVGSQKAEATKPSVKKFERWIWGLLHLLGKQGKPKSPDKITCDMTVAYNFEELILTITSSKVYKDFVRSSDLNTVGYGSFPKGDVFGDAKREEKLAAHLERMKNKKVKVALFSLFFTEAMINKLLLTSEKLWPHFEQSVKISFLDDSIPESEGQVRGLLWSLFESTNLAVDEVVFVHRVGHDKVYAYCMEHLIKDGYVYGYADFMDTLIHNIEKMVQGC